MTTPFYQNDRKDNMNTRLGLLLQRQEDYRFIAIQLQNFLGVDTLSDTMFHEVHEILEQLEYEIAVETYNNTIN
jgi:hypothetical protein